MNWKARGLARGAPALQSSYDAENATVFAEHEGPRKLSGLTVRNANRYIDGVTLTDARDPALERDRLRVVIARVIINVAAQLDYSVFSKCYSYGCTASFLFCLPRLRLPLRSG